VEAPVICTIVASNYLAYARCLAKSFLSHHPDGKVFALVVDNPGGGPPDDSEPFTVVPVIDIREPGLSDLARRYTVVELCTAVKPFFLQHLFEKYGFEKLCYFDPDIWFYDRIDELFALLDEADFVLLPHILDFLDDGFIPDELRILQVGAYNLGFLGLARRDKCERFLTWWKGKLLKYCRIELDRGLFVDQRWMDLVPSLFAKVYIHRDPSCDVAYWNLSHRFVTRDGGRYLVNGVPLKFFHFSGLEPENMGHISRHQTRFTLDQRPELKPLFEAYCRELASAGYRAPRHLGRSFYLRFAEILLRTGIGRVIQRVLGERIIGAVRRLFFGRSEYIRLPPTDV